ncbi:oxidoreductase [Bacillus sp. FJAT-28004]|uniref:oxidoreductase n=1 Tax=Bacillus sp. FJAT-28004 TaxID=1679165 RepID=UPI0006B69121|nr:oxidoreductase [Bacillus sp. FJAT-28004]
MKELKVGLIGYGYAGKNFHAPIITSIPQMKLAKVVQRKSSDAKERYPWIEVVRDASDVLQDSSIELVVVATPSADHYSYARAALLAGKHVVVEKPFTIHEAEARSLIAIAKEQGKMISVFHNRRFDGDFITIRKIIEQGMLGRLVDVRFSWDRYIPHVNPSEWRESGNLGAGVLYDLAVHFIDQALQLFGLPYRIQADVRKMRDHAAADDYFDIQLAYRNGPKVTLQASLLRREKGPRYVLHGMNGSYVKYGEDSQEEALLQGLAPGCPGWGKEEQHLWGTMDTKLEEVNVVGQIETMPGSYESYYQNVYNHIVHNAELLVKPEEAQLTIQMVELALKSSREGRAITIQP